MFFREHRTRARGLADLLNWAVLYDDGIVLNKDGSYLAGWSYYGPDLDSSTPSEVAALSAHVNSALLQLGNGWLLHADAIRRPSSTYPEVGAFPDPVTRLIDEERRQQYETGGRTFETRYVLTLTYLPPPELQARAATYLVEGRDTTGVDWAGALDAFKRRLADIEDVLARHLRLSRLDSGELLTHLHSCLTGLHHPVAVPPVPCYLDSLLASQDLHGGFKPVIGDNHLRLIAVTGFPLATKPAILDSLNRLPIEYRWSSRFMPLDAQTAGKHISRLRRTWMQKRKGLISTIKDMTGKNDPNQKSFVDRDADLMGDDADAALAQANSGLVRWGYYTPVLVITASTSAIADENARTVLKELRNQGFAARVEDINALEAFRGSLPGHGYPNVRRPLIHTLNLADLLPTTAVWPGDASSPNPMLPANSPALLYAATAGSTPFRLNLHVSDVGHTMILGPTGAGKSTLVALIEAQFFRYPNARVYVFDKGYSSWPLCLAAHGRHYAIAADNAEGDGVERHAFYPLADIDRPSDRAWYAWWLESLFMQQDVRLSTAQRGAIDSALEQLSAAPKAERSLTELQVLLQDAQLRQALAPYILKNSNPLGYLLDADRDSFQDSPLQVFEMSHLMDLGPQYVIPVLLHLFHKIERGLDGRPTLVFLEEAWTFLKHPIFADKIQSWLKELRKHNAAVIFITQSLGDLEGSPLRHVLYESCPTRLLLANPNAATPAGAAPYRAIGLNDRQIEIVASAVPKRDYYYASPAGRRLLNLSLGPLALAFVGAGSKEAQRDIRALMRLHAELWPIYWLKQQGLGTWADALAADLERRPQWSAAPASS